MSNSPTREYSGPDSDIIDQGEKVSKYLPTYKQDFISHYPTVFNEDKFADLNARIAKARQIPSDLTMRTHLTTQTAAVVAIYDSFEPMLDIVILSADAAFPDDATIQAEFGMGRKKDINSSVSAMHKYLSDFPMLWANYGKALVSASCPETMADDMAALEHKLSSLKTSQGVVKDERHTNTFNRIDNLNKIWKALLDLEKYAVGIYGKDSPTANLFHLNRGNKSPPKGQKLNSTER